MGDRKRSRGGAQELQAADKQWTGQTKTPGQGEFPMLGAGQANKEVNKSWFG